MASSTKLPLNQVDKVKFLRCLWEASKPAAFFGGFGGPAFNENEAKKAVNDYIDYFCGRCIKMDFRGEQVDSYLFDRDFGQGKAKECFERAKRM